MCFRSKSYTLNEVVSESNVKGLSEIIAFDCVRAFTRFSSAKFFSDLYNDLVKDVIYQADIRRPFSSAYDLVMEAYCFLYSNLGKRLKDTIAVTKYGVLKTMTVLDECALMLAQHIRREYFSYNCVDILTLNEDVYYCDCEYSDKEWNKVDEIIAKLDLNEKEKATLELLISGKSLSETARTICCGVSTVYDRRIKIQKKYLSLKI